MQIKEEIAKYLKKKANQYNDLALKFETDGVITELERDVKLEQHPITQASISLLAEYAILLAK